jgi:hypothetical protein
MILFFLEYYCVYVVVDAIPEKRESLKLCQRQNGRSKRVFYVHERAGYGKQIKPHDEKEHAITVDRTYWLDIALGRFRNANKTIKLPRDIPLDYTKQIMALIKSYRRDISTGNMVGEYVKKENEADHFAHCRVYNELALVHAVRISSNQDYSRR